MPEKKQKKTTEKPQYDVVVIGTGMGGAAAGAICALHGLKTLILEKNPRPGGACSYYEKQGFHVDTGAHMFIRANKGPFGDCTRRLGMGDAIDFKTAKKITRFKGFGVDMAISRNIFGMMAAAPVSALKLKIPPGQLPGAIKLFYDMLTMDESQMEALDPVTIDEFVARYSDHVLMKSLLGFLLNLFFVLPGYEISAGETIWNIQHFIKGANLYYPRGGAVAIPNAFLEGAQNHGAQVRLNAGVKKIEVKDGRVRAVVTKDGHRITTRTVISTTALADTMNKLVGARYFPAPFKKKVNSIKGARIAVQAKIALDKPLVDAGSLVGGNTHVDWSDGQVILNKSHKDVEQGRIPEFMVIYAPVPTNFDPSLAPPGCQMVTVSALAPTLDIPLKDPPQAWIDKMMDTMREMIPGMDDHLIFCDTWSVKNIADWIGKSTGSCITTGQTVDQAGVRRPGHNLPIKGLYAAGDCAGPARGIGTELACQSGMDCADLVARDLMNHLL